jgi:cellulose synthase/poly-beta-1,6-N-acetylglucosamine synthase-like glycosyltransferase
MSTFSIAVATILWTCLALILFSYAIYPLLIWCLSRWFARRVVPTEFEQKDWPSVSLLIAAYNEEDVIEERVRNALEMDYPRDRLEIVIALDGCSDGTASIVRRYQSQGVRLLDFPERRGKSAVLNAAIGAVEGEIVLLSDANTGIDPQAARRLARWFGHPHVGAVCGRLVLTDPHTGRNVDSLYWKYETFLKRCEGRLGALLGANGAIYAIRKELYQPIPSQTLIDDFVIPLLAKLRSGCSIIYESSAVATEETPADVHSEFHRRARIGAGGFQSIGMLWKLLDPRQGWVALSFLFHKVLRWFCPFFMIGVLASNLLLLDIPFYRLVLMSQFGFYLLSVLAAFLPASIKFLKPLRLATMFTSMNLALFVGFWRWLSGRQNGVWIRTSRIAGNQEMSDEPSKFHLSRSN